ncbi:hypothetical protein, partial [Streptomyces sp. WAC05950]|uniref:hypothetical protein n=1 Tax=Streptomyces sp. WAC05950 TaxID=2487419 RepID=UPI001C8DAD3B
MTGVVGGQAGQPLRLVRGDVTEADRHPAARVRAPDGARAGEERERVTDAFGQGIGLVHAVAFQRLLKVPVARPNIPVA